MCAGQSMPWSLIRTIFRHNQESSTATARIRLSGRCILFPVPRTSTAKDLEMQVCSLAPRGIRVIHPGYPGFLLPSDLSTFQTSGVHSAFEPTRMKRVVIFISCPLPRPTLAESRPYLSSGFSVCFIFLTRIESGGR